MPKGVSDGAAEVSSSAQLDQRIRALELALANPSGLDAVELLTERTAVEYALAALAERGRDVRAERSRLDTIDNMIRSNAAMLVARVKGGRLPALREQITPPEDHWWWWLDDQVAEARRGTARRFIILVVGAAVVVLVASFLLSRFGGTPEQRQAAVYSSQGDQRITQGDYTGAIDAYEQSLAIIAEQPEVLAALVALYDKQGQAQDAQMALESLQRVVTEQAQLEAGLARAYEMAQECELALEHAQRAVAADASYANAYLVRGSALECLDRWDEAMADYERASDLAMEQGQDALYVLARTRYGMLLQMSGSGMPSMTTP